MRIVSAFLFVLLGVNASLFGQDSLGDLELAEERAFKQAAVLASPSIVRIDTVGGLDVVGRMLTSTAPTTGVVVSEDGYIVSSAFNFVSNPASVLVTLGDGERKPAKIIATDKLRMVTLIKIDASGLKPARPANKSTLRVGQWAIALGRTYDSELPSVSVGIVSAVNRVWGKAIQTDAKVSPVNYGGPLVDVDGNAMGVLVPLSPRGTSETAGVEWYDSGIGFAIPLEDIYRVLDRLKEGTDLRPGLAGFSLTSRDLYAVEPVIGRVRYDSPAWHAGLKADDRILEMDGKKTVRVAQVMQIIKSRLEGEELSIKVKRGDEEVSATMKLVGELLPWESPFLGILPNRSDDAVGIRVRYVYEGSPAAEAMIRKGDRILKFNGQAVSDSVSLLNEITKVRPGQEASVTFRRDDQEQTATVPLASLPDEIPAELSPPIIRAPEEEKAEDAPQSGRFTDKLPGYDQEHWAYVPEQYNAQYNYGLLVWVHPPGQRMQADVFQAWKTICDLRGLILVAPQSARAEQWSANEAEYVRDVVKHFQETYSIDPGRVVIHSYGRGAVFASNVAFKFREVFHGLLLAGQHLPVRPPENEPDFRLQIHFVCGDRDPALRFVRLSRAALQSAKIPTTLTVVPDLARKYPSEHFDEAERWLDSLDRL